MITVDMHHDKEGRYTGFSIHGHADGYEKDGEYDLICAAVSAITLTIAGGLQDVLHKEGTYDSDFGFMEVEISSPDEKARFSSAPWFTVFGLWKPGIHPI